MNIKIYADNLEKSVAEQIEHIKQSKLFDFPKTVVRIMPDTHFGMGAVIGFTSKGNKILIPDFIGVDIGCGVLATEIKNFKPEFELIDKTIKETVPMGFTSHTDKNIIANYQNILDTTINSKKIISCLVPSASQIGTLGGGNHFMSIEIVDGKTYFIVHSGSRNFGLKVCEFWQKQAEIDCAELIECGIISKDLAYLKDKHRDGYINDMVIAQQYASLNRQQIVSQVFTALG
jgi:RNA-splicing ligase RtcB